GRPILTRPVGAVGRIRKWIERKPVIAGLLFLLLLVGTLGLGAFAWQYRRTVAKGASEASARRSAQEAVARLRILAAEDYFNDNTPVAIAYLARVLRDNPSNEVAAERLLSALTYRKFA